MTEYLPFTDGVIKFVFQEEKSYWESMRGAVGGIESSFSIDDSKKSIKSMVQKKQAEVKSAAEEYTRKL